MQKVDKNKKIINPETGKLYIRGRKYIHPISGDLKIFDSYATTTLYKNGKYNLSSENNKIFCVRFKKLPYNYLYNLNK